MADIIDDTENLIQRHPKTLCSERKDIARQNFSWLSLCLTARMNLLLRNFNYGR